MFFQFHDCRREAHEHLVPEQVELIMLGDPELGQPAADSVDSFCGTAGVVVDDVLHIEFIGVLNRFTKFFTHHDPPQRKQGADSRFAVMHTASSILQQRAGTLGSVGE